MGKYDFELGAAKDRLLSDLKKQDEPGAMRPKMYKFLINHDESSPPDLKLQWMFYAGMGEVGFSNLHSEKEEEAARKLLEEGRLVPTFTEEHYSARIQHISHFEDVNWGKTSAGDLIIFNLTDFEGRIEWPDKIITPDKTHDTAIAYLKQKSEYGKTMEDSPILMSNGLKITPILTNPELIKFRKRQEKGLTP